jgi:hypothetical protein
MNFQYVIIYLKENLNYTNFNRIVFFVILTKKYSWNCFSIIINYQNIIIALKSIFKNIIVIHLSYNYNVDTLEININNLHL